MSGPYRDGRVHVRGERCPTCVFRPGNLMSLEPGRLASLVADNLNADSALQCHQTLDHYPGHEQPAVCRGFHDAYWEQSTPLRLAVMLGLITETGEVRP